MPIMDIRTILSTEDKKKIENYINYYGGGAQCQGADLVLSEWGRAKESLYHALGDNLIIEFPVKYALPLEDMKSKCYDALYDCHNEWYESFYTYLAQLQDNFTIEVSDAALFTPSSYWFMNIFANLEALATGALLSNADQQYLISKKTGKTFKFKQGEKYFRALGKLVRDAEADFEPFEKFRIKISQITNQKKLNGTMCISIHPLDYMTMSDNDYGWDSCMNWATDDGGDYRMGTVEMMNSPTVVVAYLKGDGKHAKYQWGIQDWQYWNNKKWRELFIVTPEWINEIKAYPYDNAEFTRAVMDKLREIITWEPVDYTSEIYYNSSTTFGKYKGRLRFSTANNGMYNDMGLFRNQKGHLMYYNKDAVENYFTEDNTWRGLVYSGNKTCMSCGSFIDDEDAESNQIMCPQCGTYEREFCTCCGRGLRRDDDIYWNRYDEPYCESCYDEYYVQDELFDEEIDSEDAIDLYLIVGEPTDDSWRKSQHYYTSINHLINYFGIEPMQYDDDGRITYYYNLYDIIENGNCDMARKFGFVLDSDKKFVAQRWSYWRNETPTILSLVEQIESYQEDGYISWSAKWAS